MCILELSYDYIKNKYNNKLKLLFTVTDSLMYKINTDDVFEGFSSDKEMFNFSNYSTQLKYHDGSSKLVIGKIKENVGVVPVEEFAGLKPMFIHSQQTVMNIKK